MVTFTVLQKHALKLHAAGVILTGHNIAWTRLRAGHSMHHEPVFAAYLCASLSYLATPWRAELRQIAPNARLTISSVFTHQRPYAGATITATVPLQDLLVDFLDGCAGFDFILSAPGDNWTVLDNAGQSWSALINFILQDAVNAKSPRYAPKSWSRRSDGGRALSGMMFDANGIPFVTVNQDPSSTWHSQDYRVTLADKLLWNLQSNREPPHDDPPRDGGERDDGQWGGMSVVLMEMSAHNN